MFVMFSEIEITSKDHKTVFQSWILGKQEEYKEPA